MEAAVSMYIVFVVVAAVVVFAVAAAAVGHGDGLEEPFPDMERPYLPDGKVEPVDIDDVHFAVAFRGYRMDQVDSVLDRLAEELIKRDQHISRLERIVHTQTVQSAAVGYSGNRSNRGAADSQSMPTVQPDQQGRPPAPPPPGGPGGERPDDTSA
jgi:DivIVA domain-containing protein